MRLPIALALALALATNPSSSLTVIMRTNNFVADLKPIQYQGIELGLGVELGLVARASG